MLQELAQLERPEYPMEIMFDWCTTIYKNRQNLEEWESLLFASLEIGFRQFDPQKPVKSTHDPSKDYPEMADAVFGSRNSEVIADLLYGWITCHSIWDLSGILENRLLYLHNRVPFSPRLRRLVIRCVELLGCGGFVESGVGKFVELLDHLHVTVEDMDDRAEWLMLLLETLQTPEGPQHLSHWYWELVVELAVLQSQRHVPTYSPLILESLVKAQEWSKLECWMGTVWTLWPPEADGITEEDLGDSIHILFEKRPCAFQKLEQWMERWSNRFKEKKDIPGSFQRICGKAYKAVQRDTP